MRKPTTGQLAAWIAMTVVLVILSLFAYRPAYSVLLPVAWLVWGRRRHV